MSKARPVKTKAVPSHCRRSKECPNTMTEANMVKNFLVVVAMEQGSGPNDVTIRKIKCCNRQIEIIRI